MLNRLNNPAGNAMSGNIVEMPINSLLQTKREWIRAEITKVCFNKVNVLQFQLGSKPSTMRNVLRMKVDADKLSFWIASSLKAKT